jgi:hypothetical protein
MPATLERKLDRSTLDPHDVPVRAIEAIPVETVRERSRHTAGKRPPRSPARRRRRLLPPWRAILFGFLLLSILVAGASRDAAPDPPAPPPAATDMGEVDSANERGTPLVDQTAQAGFGCGWLLTQPKCECPPPILPARQSCGPAGRFATSPRS